MKFSLFLIPLYSGQAEPTEKLCLIHGTSQLKFQACRQVFFTHRNFANLFPLFALLSPAGLAERLQESVTNSAEDGGEVGGLKRSGGGKSDGGV